MGETEETQDLASNSHHSHFEKNESAFSLIELLVVLLAIIIFATAAVVQFNHTIESYDLTRLTSELVGKLEAVRAECVKQSDPYPAAALSVTANTTASAYTLQFYYTDPTTKNVVHTDYAYNMLPNYMLQVTPSTATYTFNPRGKALAYGSAQYDKVTPPLASLPTITVQNTRNTNLKRTIAITVAGSISVQ